MSVVIFNYAIEAAAGWMRHIHIHDLKPASSPNDESTETKQIVTDIDMNIITYTESDGDEDEK